MTDTDLHARASALFLELRALPGPARAAALAAAATGEPRLAAEVSSLLAHDVEDGPEPPGTAEASGEPGLPARIGPYRVIARIGRGGSGHVFLAEQDQPIRRRVAIKVVPQAAVSPELAARFEVERRALECTDHPNITRVLDAGRTPDGLPYLVMNLVEGEPITDHCVRHALPLAERLRLMLDVADAVQHAHQRGVIHRDLKPANILVMETDGRPIPQVLDFGIAKPVGGELLAESPPTMGLPMGTPAYMAPEQTGLGGVDTRADVYALGALLYELVAGRPPIETGGDPLEGLRRLRETVPQPASRARAEGSPRAAPGPASRALLADLDVVLAKGLEKSPERRYASVGALIDDLRRLLACEPIAARPPTLRYRAARFAQRNRMLVASIVIVVAALCVGVAGLAAGLLEARRQRAEAERQAEEKNELNRFLTDDLLSGAELGEGGRTTTVLDLVNRASQNIDERFPDRPLVAAAVHNVLGEIFAQLGVFDEAERHIQRAVTMRRAAAGADAPDTVRSEIAAASLLGRRQKMGEAQAVLVPLITRARLVLGPDDPDLYSALNDLGVVLLALDRTDEALAALQEAFDGRSRLLGRTGGRVKVTSMLLMGTLSNLADAQERKGDTEGALVTLRAALDVVEKAPGEQRMSLLLLENNLGASLQDLARNTEAEPHLRRAAEIADELLGPDHPDTLSIEGNLAGLQSDLGETDRALELFHRVIERRTTQLGPTAIDTLTPRHGLCVALWKAGRIDEAIAGFTELLRDATSALGADHVLVAQTESSLARALIDAGHPDEALPHAQRARERLLALYGPDHVRTATATRMIETISGLRAEPASR